MAVTITDAELQQLRMDNTQLRVEMACHFYHVGRMSIGQASKFAKLDRVSFQQELSKRGININYTVDDLMNDIKTLDKLGL